MASPLLAACSSSDDAALAPVHVVTSPDWNVALALVSDGDDVFAAHLTRLDEHRADGTVRSVAGVDYASCPPPVDERWAPLYLDRGYPRLVVSGDRILFSEPLCGVWSVSRTDGRARALLASSYGDPQWGGRPGPRWHPTSPIAVAPVGEDLAVCLTVGRFRERYSGATEEPDRIELWRVRADGTASERLASLDPRDEHCTHALADGEAVYLATDHAIYRYDLAGRALRVLTTDAGTSFGNGLWGLAQDGSSLFLLRGAAIERVPKDGSTRTVLLQRPRPQDPGRAAIAAAGEHLYWVEGPALKRMPKAGGPPETIVHGDEDRWVVPTSFAITSSHVWFQRAERVTAHSVHDPETGLTLDDVDVLFSLERVAR